MFIVVDLPDPDAPMIATKSPEATSRSTPFSAWNAALPSPKRLVMPRSAISGSPTLLARAGELPGDDLETRVQPRPADFGEAAVGVPDRYRHRLGLAVGADHPQLLPRTARHAGILRLILGWAEHALLWRCWRFVTQGGIGHEQD